MAESKSAGFGLTAKRKKLRDEEDVVIYQHDFSGLIPGDVALAVENGIRSLGLKFKEITTKMVNGMSGVEEEVPFIRYQSAGGHEIPFGSYRVPTLGEVGMKIATNGPLPVLRLTCIFESEKSSEVWKALLKAIKEIASRDTIFKGQALKIQDSMDFLVPNILPLSEELNLIFNPHVEQQLNTCVFWPIQNRDVCKRVGIRTRRGTIFEGHYGTGKSALLYEAARVAHKSGWGILNVSASWAGAGIAFAGLLEPVVIVVEDIDSYAHGNRDRLNSFLNSVSSVATKTSGDFALLLSTNFIDRIEPALLRPERIDAIINIELPNQETIKKLLTSFLKGRLRGDIDLISAKLVGTTPAIICEVVQRALIDAEMTGNEKVTEISLLHHTEMMDRQRKLAVPEFKEDHIGTQLAENLAKVCGGDF